MELKIERMAAEHVKSLALLEKQCFSEPRSEKQLLQELENEGAFFIVARKGAEVAGYGGMHVVLDECYIDNIAVFSDYRGMGVGTTLLEGLIKKAAELEAQFITLEVRKSNVSAIRLYEKHGFKIEGERRDFYRKPTENALILTKRELRV